MGHFSTTIEMTQILTQRIIKHNKPMDAKIYHHATGGHDSCLTRYQIIRLDFGSRLLMHLHALKKTDASPHDFANRLYVVSRTLNICEYKTPTETGGRYQPTLPLKP